MYQLNVLEDTGGHSNTALHLKRRDEALQAVSSRDGILLLYLNFDFIFVLKTVSSIQEEK